MEFDLMKYAAENACSIEIKPRFENYEKINTQRLVGWQVAVMKDFPDGNVLRIKRIIGVLGLNKEVLDSMLKEVLNSMLTELSDQWEARYKAGTTGKQLRDREAFFKGK